MIIKYGCATLRAVEEKDFELLLYLINAPEIERGLIGWNFPVNHLEQKKWMENFKNSFESIKLMIELENLKTIGMIMLEKIDLKNRTAEIAYKISAPMENRIRGDMSDALKGMLKYAFDELGLNCITAMIQEENILSRNLCGRVGFVEEGVLRKRIYKEGKFKNVIAVSLLKEEFCG